MSDLLPNFLHIGPSKSGSTWLHEVLIGHPEVFLSQAKDLYYFNRYYDRGVGWYRAQFRGAQPQHKIIGEVCPDYLASGAAPERIHDCLGGDIRLMVTLRDPISRAFSAYLYLAKHGQAAATFRDTTKTAPSWSRRAATPPTCAVTCAISAPSRCTSPSSTTWKPARRRSSTASPTGSASPGCR